MKNPGLALGASQGAMEAHLLCSQSCNLQRREGGELGHSADGTALMTLSTDCDLLNAIQ
jgi:hypothetical protein